jgi:tetratricopeptide (TPR) repeat protein
MAKSMLVTLPFLLLLLDYWPLRRFKTAAPGKGFFAALRALATEKLPLFGLSLICSVVQLVSDKEGIISTERMPLPMRTGNAIVSYTDYIWQFLYPLRLSVFYRHPESALAGSKIAVSLAVLILISAAAIAFRKSRPWLIIGWLWYLGMLVPVIGLIQSGEIARADRYTYLPQIGLALSVTWLAAELSAGIRHRSLILSGVAAMIIGSLALAAHRQTASWRNTTALWANAIAVNPMSAFAHVAIADALSREGRADEAMRYYLKALEIDPMHAAAHNNIGNALLDKGETEAAVEHFRKAIQRNPRYAIAHNNLGSSLLKMGRSEEAAEQFKRAIELNPNLPEAEANLGSACFRNGRLANEIFHYQRAIELDPEYTKAHVNLASALFQAGRGRDAVPHLEKVVDLNPDSANAHANLGQALLLTGEAADGAAHLKRALELQPGFPGAQNSLAWLLATHPDSALRDGSRAVELASAAARSLGDRNALYLRTLAAAYAESGRYTEAAQTVEHALELPATDATSAIRDSLQGDLELYRSGYPLREKTGTADVPTGGLGSHAFEF